jgi:cyclomaltodextrin glucanotransferase
MEETRFNLKALAGSDIEFRAETIYFLVLDRFHAGNPLKPRERDELFDPDHRDWGKYWGGDLQGLLDKLEYLRSFGIGAIWTTPLFEQVEALAVADGETRAPIHGYWTSDFKRINPRWMNNPAEKRLFTRDDTVFDKLLGAMHASEMKFVLDFVCNHSSPETTDGKGKLYDDGKLIADFENDTEHWYHHYGPTTDWCDEWQIQNAEIGGLATFNENNIRYRRYIKEAARLWLAKGVDALRIDTVKHMPLWFWQEFCGDIDAAKPDVFRFGEWIHSDPEDAKPVDFSNRSGMSILDFGFCSAARECFAGKDGKGFNAFTRVFDLDRNYSCASELVTFFENHDMPRLQSLGVSDRQLELALVLLLSSRGIPCLYYGCEQYLHDDTGGGDDPYNRPMMQRWGETEATRLIGILAAERRSNAAIRFGGQWTKWIDENTYVFLRCYRDARCLVMLNKGPARKVELSNLDYPDGSHACLLTKMQLEIRQGAATVELPDQSALVFSERGNEIDGKALARILVNGAPTNPGDRLAVIGDCPELGCWDLSQAIELECINTNTWFGEIPFDPSAGQTIGYKYVIFPADPNAAPNRENRWVRRRLVPPEKCVKWRDQWEL